MIKRWIVFGLGFLASAGMLWADDSLSDRVEAAIRILGKRQKATNPIPAEILKKARGVAIIRVARGGLGIGGAHGEGVVVARTAKGWSAPCAFDQSAGSVGLQIGFEQKDFIYVLNTSDAVEAFTTEESTRFDAKATATAGPDHVSEDVVTPPDVYVYTNSDGAFAGATIGGQNIGLERGVNRKAYGEGVTTREILEGKVAQPKYAQELYKLLDAGSAAKKK